MKTPNDIEIKSWSDLIEQLYHGSLREDINRHRSNYAFRGLSSTDYNLKTSLIRLGGNYYELEFHLMRNFIKYARIESSTNNTIWDWLALAQHHGLPTRLLDWTYSPFVAMHFATANTEKYDEDGVIWCVDYTEMNILSSEALREELEREGSNVFTVEMLANVAGSLRDFDNISETAFVLFFEPPSMDYRIVNQYALHSVISDPKIKLSDILLNHPKAYKRIIIPCSLKWEIRDKLDQANINERVIFPGLDGLSKWLARHYSPR